MTLSYVNGGAVVWTTASNPVVGYPAGAATDAIVGFAAGKPPAFAATHASWTLLGECVSGTAGAAVDDGPTRNSGFLRTSSPTAAASDTWAVTGSPSPALLRTLRFARSTGVGWLSSYTGLIDADETGTAVVATAPVTAGQYAAGDMVAITVVTKSDAIIHTAQALTIPGVTLDTVTWFARYLTTTGADGSAYSGYALVLSGTSTAGDATYAATSSVSGGAATTVSLVRLREDPGTASETHTTTGTATAVASASGVTTTTRTRTGTAASAAGASATTNTTRASTGTATATAAASATSGTTRATAGTALAVASASAVTSRVDDQPPEPEVHVTTGTATAVASGGAQTSTVRTTAGTAAGVASAAGQTTTTRVTAATATAWALGAGETTTERVTTGTALAYATASAITSNPSHYRDITITLTGPTGHPFTGGAPTRHPLIVTGPTGAPLTVTGPRS